MRCCLYYLAGKGVRGDVHGGAVWSARGPLSHGRDNEVQASSIIKFQIKQSSFLFFFQREHIECKQEQDIETIVDASFP